VLSALQKSIRGSDTDAALHYAARLVKAGDLTSLLRRLIIICYEDISLADPQVATNMVAAAQACERVGFPEATGILSMMIVQMCNSPKSKTGWSALYDALADVESGFVGEIPMHLRDTHYASAVKLGHVGYLYPHDYPQENFGGWVKQQYLPDDLKDRKYYEPLKVGKEKYYGEIYERLKKQQK
jgi:putative ATPase